MRTQHLLSALYLSGLAAAAPRFSKRGSGTDQASVIIAAIMPGSTSCAGGDECRTNVQAAPFFIDAFVRYKIFNYAQMASVLALTSVESVDLKFKRNQAHPGTGQGTSNMQMANYNKLYAESIPELSAGLAAAGGDANAILDLLVDDKYNFGSGAWFLATQCPSSVLDTFKTDPDAGFAAHMACVGVPADNPDRAAAWTRAKSAFGL